MIGPGQVACVIDPLQSYSGRVRRQESGAGRGVHHQRFYPHSSPDAAGLLWARDAAFLILGQGASYLVATTCQCFIDIIWHILLACK